MKLLLFLKKFNALFVELPFSYRKSVIPPKKLMMRVTGNSSYQSFQHGSFILTQTIFNALQQYSKYIQEDLLDWGCGCGRVAINLLRNEKINYTGCDIDSECITWCKQNLSESQFFVNDFNPPLPFEDKQLWLKEIHRTLQPNGLFLATTLGEASAKVLGEAEQFATAEYLDRTSNAIDGIAPKGKYKDTFQTKEYTYKNWTEYFDILEYKETAIGHQDLVVMRKKEQ